MQSSERCSKWPSSSNLAESPELSPMLTVSPSAATRPMMELLMGNLV